jgi:hypothetical protein
MWFAYLLSILMHITLSFGGRPESGGYESELGGAIVSRLDALGKAAFLLPVIIKCMTHTVTCGFTYTDYTY